MSKRPKTGRSRLVGVGSLAGFLGDRRIGIKLGFIMFVPTLATVIVGANGLVSQISNANSADRARSLASLSADAGTLAHALQNERAQAVILQIDRLNSKFPTNEIGTDPAVAASTKAYVAQQKPTDDAKAVYLQQVASEPDLPSTVTNILSEVADKLDGVTNSDGLRFAVNNTLPNNAASPGSTASTYQVLIGRLLSIRDASAQLAGDPALSFQMRSAAAISQIEEYASQEREIGSQLLLPLPKGSDTSTAQLQQDLIGAKAGQSLELNQFLATATLAENAQANQIASPDALSPSKSVENTILGGNGTSSSLTVDQWNTAMASRADAYRKVEVALDNETKDQASAIVDRVERQIIIDVGLLFGIVLIAMLIAWFVARSMNRSLRELKHGALTVARQGLPQAVARLRDPSLATQLSPQQIALQIAEPLPIRTRDEFGEVTEAFNAVHIEAVRTAAEQAVLRSSVATMFVNLARRSQILVDRLIGHLDRLERGEEDPDRLAELFQLDHLATRMRRNDENLLVLAGADSTRVQREPAPLVDVLRAAQSEVEHYTRIDFGSIDRDLEVASHAVNDLVHLVAELLDNATAFSPPDSPVLIEARRFGDRAVLYVEDRGIGISADQLDELNERLAKPPLVDVAVSRMMGLVVVARLAARHGIEVKLRPAPDRGTVADVLLPPAVLVSHAGAFRGAPAAVGAERAALGGEAHRPPPRAPFGPPLALESGPSTHEPISAGQGNTSGYAGAGYAQSDYEQPSEFGAFAESSGYADAGERPGSSRPALLGPGVSSRALPSWSDLTGATITGAGSLAGSGYPGGFNGAPGPYHGNGHNGANGNGHGGPQGFNAVPASPLPRRSPQNPDEPHDANGPDGSGAEPRPFEPHSFAPHPFEPRNFDAGQDPARPRVPRQRPNAFESLRDAAGDGVTDAEVIDDAAAQPSAPVGDPFPARYDDRPGPSSAPPAWPPVVGQAPDEVNDLRGAGRGEGMDMTAEIPRYRDLDLASAVRNERAAPEYGADVPTGQSGPRGYVEQHSGGVRPVVPHPAGPSAPEVMPFADETMELPIFRALESQWFATTRSGRSSLTGDARPAEVATAEASSRPTVMTTPAWPEQRTPERRMEEVRTPEPRAAAPRSGGPTGPGGPAGGRHDYYSDTTGSNYMAGSATPADRAAEQDWQTGADQGWLAAAAAAEPADGGTTAGGLPRRVPLAQLVPGSVERSATGSNRRSPDAVRGLLSAYHRGVQRGRQQTSDDINTAPESTTSGRTAPGGKEQDR